MKTQFMVFILIIMCTALFCTSHADAATSRTLQTSILPQIGQFSNTERNIPTPPTDVTISITSGTLKLSWTAVSGVSGYHVEGSNASSSGFTDISSTGSFSTSANTKRWSTTVSSPYHFYRVKSLGIPILPFDSAVVQGGTFNNGAGNMTISTFYMDKYETTQGDYQAIMGNNPAMYYGVGVAYPVYYVSWFDAIKYCNLRSMGEDLTPCYSYLTYGTDVNAWPTNWYLDYHNAANISCNWPANGYRLPTEMEWRFAARGGNLTHSYSYSGSNTIGGVAWYTTNSSGSAHIVGTKTANELGIFDLTGNVWEWCWDIFAESYPYGDQTDPHGPSTGMSRAYCGGSRATNAAMCIITYHIGTGSYADTSYYTDLGFRVCRAH
jgi:formylglycine-generating enzyme